MVSANHPPYVGCQCFCSYKAFLSGKLLFSPFRYCDDEVRTIHLSSFKNKRKQLRYFALGTRYITACSPARRVNGGIRVEDEEKTFDLEPEAEAISMARIGSLDQLFRRKLSTKVAKPKSYNG